MSEQLALTPVQVREFNLPSIPKLDRRYKPPRPGVADETEALSQTIIQTVPRGATRVFLTAAPPQTTAYDAAALAAAAEDADRWTAGNSFDAPTAEDHPVVAE
ncbi:MAG: hypothetical protein ACLQHS_19225 [Candidatus Limnocylindrales bacterium]